MDQPFAKYQITAPLLCVGNVIGELSRIGSLVDDVSHDSLKCTVHARVPLRAIRQFEKWLAGITMGEGQVAGGEPATGDPRSDAPREDTVHVEFSNPETTIAARPANDEDG
jgi:hypothetical protein